MYSPSPKAKRIEVRFPDPSCNPYLAFSAMLLAGLDGIQRRIDPGHPSTRTSTTLRPQNWRKCPWRPRRSRSRYALEADHEFLLKGDVFTYDVIQTYLAYKRSREIDEMRLRPHPYEFFLYYDV